MNNNQFGRSMIEMLGVLAIIGVLSVGAIAGYQKAMMKYKLNKQAEQIRIILDYLIINTEKLKTAEYNFVPVLNTLGIVPNNMLGEDIRYAYDIFHNRLKIENHAKAQGPGQENVRELQGLAFGLEIQDTDLSAEICRNFMIMAKERADDVSLVYVQKGDLDGTIIDGIGYHGNIQDKNHYLRDLDIPAMDNVCRVCKDTSFCTIFALIGYKVTAFN